MASSFVEEVFPGHDLSGDLVQTSLVLDHNNSLNLEDVLSVARQERRVVLASDTCQMLTERRKQIESFILDSGGQHYGFNRGFGSNVNLAVSESDLAELQKNLLRSHAFGVGERVPIEVSRAAMLLRAASLSKGNSGVRSIIVERLIDMLNAGVVSSIPRFGSVGASGDLAPLSHMALPIIGEGEVYWTQNPDSEKRNVPLETREVLQALGWEAIELQMKEGLALNNGMQFATALGIISWDEVRNILEHAVLASALSAQTFLASDGPFRTDLHALRPHPGSVQVANWLSQLMKNSPIREFHRPYQIDGKIQDPYSLRCTAPILGACLEQLMIAEKTLSIEANSVTDNPVVLKLTPENLPYIERGNLSEKELEERLGQYIDIVSGPHFHGMPLAGPLYGMLQAMAVSAKLSNLRAARYVDPARNNGLPAHLKWAELNTAQQATSSAMMIPEYASASLTNWLLGMSMPSHLFSLPTDAGQEDHVSMATNIAVRIFENWPRFADVIGIELAYAAQAAAIRKVQGSIPAARGEKIEWEKQDRLLNVVGERVLEAIYDKFPIVKEDRAMYKDFAKLVNLVRSRTLIKIAAETLER